jgi:hypothetical protein
MPLVYLKYCNNGCEQRKVYERRKEDFPISSVTFILHEPGDYNLSVSSTVQGVSGTSDIPFDVTRVPAAKAEGCQSPY